MWGWFDTSTSNWTISSTGAVRNAFGGADTTRTLTATVHVRPAPSQDNYVTAWNYVLRGHHSGVCNLTMQNSSSVNISLYIEGNLCFQNSSSVAEDDIADECPGCEPRGPRQDRLAERFVQGNREHRHQLPGQRCRDNGKDRRRLRNGAHRRQPPLFLAWTTTSTSRPAGYSTTAPAISAPILTDTDFTNYYGSPRPSGDPCDSPGPNAGNRLANTTFDNDTTALNGTGGNGSAATFDLTPASNYTCRATDAQGHVLAELDWDNSSKILTIRGTFYFDGSLTVSQAGVYRGINSAGNHPSGDLTGNDGIGGQAVLYASGGFTMSNSAQLCGWNTRTDAAAMSGGNCSFSLWTPNTSMLMIVTHKAGAASVSFSQSSQFQGGIYAVGDVSTGNSSEVDGPMLTNSVTIGNSVTLRPIPAITDLPLGAPGNPNTAGIPDAPAYGGG